MTHKRHFGLVALILFAVTLICVGIFAACSNNNDYTPPTGGEETALTVELSKTTLTLDVLAREQIDASIKDGDGNVVAGEIVWTSSSPEIASVTGGRVVAKSAGSAVITASYGDSDATCDVTVENNGVRPQLILNVDSLDLHTGNTSTIVPSVRFKSFSVDEEECGITYSYSADDSGVVSVSSTGTVTALKYGQGTITVKAAWAEAAAAGLDGNLTATVDVSVSAVYSLKAGIADGYSADIYLEQAEYGETTYLDYTMIEVTEAEYNGNTLTGGFVYKSGNESIATIDENGKITVADGASEGDTVEVWVEYLTENEGTLASDKITITVKKAVITLTPEQEIMFEITSSPTDLFVAAFGTTELDVVRIYDAEDAYKTNLYNVADNSYNEITLLGNRNWIIETDKIGYEVPVLAVTRIITDAEDFEIFNNPLASSQNVFPGYYVLANNIDASSWSHQSKGYPSSADGIGLTGVFDGRGYTINGLNLGSGGIFGVISSAGTVKNVAFTNLSVNAGTQGLGLVFGWYCFGKLSNVYVGIKEFSTSGTGSSASLGLFAQCSDATAFSNVVMVNSAVSEYSSAVGASQQYGSLVAATNKGAWENTFVISDIRLFGGSSTNGDTGNKYVKSVQRFESMSDMLASSYYSSGKKTFDNTIWDRQTLTFISSAEYFTNELNAIPEEIELVAGNTSLITENANAFVLTLSDTAGESGVYLSNGRLTAGNYQSADGITLTVAFGSSLKTVAISVKSAITVDYQYTYNLSDDEDFVITGDFPASGNATLSVTGTDGQTIAMQATIDGDTLTVAGTEFTGKIPSGLVTMTLKIGEATVGVNGVTLIYAINNLQDYLAIIDHLTETSSGVYDGYVKIAAPIDFTGQSFASATNYPLYRMTFTGILDGGNNVLSNINMSGSQSGAFVGTLRGTVKNVVVKNATVSTYCGIICYENYGTIENCYIKGSIVGDGLSATSNPDSFGTGLIAGKLRNGSKVRNCIVELISKADVLYAAAAFGKLGEGAASEAGIFENCYAVAADGFALMTYGASRATKNFAEQNGNANFANMFELFEDDAAAVLAKSLGLTAPVISRIELSETSVALYVGDTVTLTAKAITEDGEVIPVAMTWSVDDATVASVNSGVVTGLDAGTAKITVAYGSFSCDCIVTVSFSELEDLVLEDFTYAYNAGTDFSLTGKFPEAQSITATITGTDGVLITLSSITVKDGVLTIPAAQFAVSTMPTKEAEMTLNFDGSEMKVSGIYLICTVNTAEELSNMYLHMTTTATDTYDGHIELGADITDTLSVPYAWAMRNKTYNGIFDGKYYHISNIEMSGAGCGLLGNLGSAGIIRNVIVDNATVSSYAGILCYTNNGTIENCYIKGSITKDGLTGGNVNFGAGLIAARNANGSHVRNCIVKVISRGVINGEDGNATIWMGAAFGEIYGGSAKESAIFENCYAVNAEGFTLKPYTAAADFKNFDDANGNKNFDTMEDLLKYEPAAELAKTFGISLGE